MTKENFENEDYNVVVVSESDILAQLKPGDEIRLFDNETVEYYCDEDGVVHKIHEVDEEGNIREVNKIIKFE